MAFLDEEEDLELEGELEPPLEDDLDPEGEEEEFLDIGDEGPRGPRPPRTPRQQILVRRLVAVGAAALVLILIVVAFRGCLDARKNRAIRNFVSDAGSLMDESDQTGSDFFGLLNDAGGRTALEYEAEVKSFRGASETLYDRAQKLSAPDELSNAKSALVMSLELRRNGLTAIGNNIGQALAAKDSTEAQKKIAEQMRLLFASDAVCSGVALPEIVSVTTREGVSGEPVQVPCEFMAQPPEDWLDEAKISEALGKVTGEDTTVTAGVHGVEILSTKIGDTQLLPDTPATVSATDSTLTVEIQNGGEAEETEINVTVTVGGTDLSPQVIPRLAAGDSIPLDIPITPVPSSGAQTTIEVSVEPVPGEEVTDNNTSTYTVTFE